MGNNFFKILFLVCTGTDVFKKIIKFPLLKAFWHLFLLSVFCSFVFVLTKSPEMKKNINSATSYFQKQFGNVVVKSTGLYPEKKPATPRSLSYDFIQVNYFPKLPPNKDFKIDDRLNRSGFVWMPNCIVGWLKINDSEVFVYQALTSLDSHNWFGIFPKDKIPSYIQNSTVNDLKNLRFTFFVPTNIPLFGLLSLQQNNNLLHYSDTIFYWSAFGVLTHFVFMILLNVMLYSLIFAAVYSISSRSSLYNLKFKSFLVTAIYAGFPAVVIGTVFTIAEIPWIQYQTIYLIAFVIYLIAVTHKLRRFNIKKDGEG